MQSHKRSNHDQQSSFELNNAHEFQEAILLGISLLHHELHLINPKYLLLRRSRLYPVSSLHKQMRLNELMSIRDLPYL